MLNENWVLNSRLWFGSCLVLAWFLFAFSLGRRQARGKQEPSKTLARAKVEYPKIYVLSGSH
jgi:hypothetical protein